MENTGTLSHRRKYPAPQVRQTVSSMIRLVRANPLILENNTGTRDCTSDELRKKLPARIRDDPFGIQSKRMSVDFTKHDKNSSIFSRPSSLRLKKSTLLNKSEARQSIRSNTEGCVPRFHVFLKPHPPLPKKKTTLNSDFVLKRKSRSADNITMVPTDVPGSGRFNCTATHSMESLIIVSPINSSKHTFKTPNKCFKIRNSTPKNPKTPSLKELQGRLNSWLKKRQKLSTNFQHLKNIQDHTITCQISRKINKIEKNSEPIIEPNLLPQEDKENTAAVLNTEEKLRKDINDLHEVKDDILMATLVEMKILIEEGYDPEHCQYWLRKISQRYDKVEEMSEFWECRAALEQVSDNVNEAIECYKAAIIHGAEIQGIDESLDKLFQKFGALNLGDPDSFTPNRKSRAKNSHIICNQFKSSIIQFAILQKKVKLNTQQHKITSIVTPVRRSSRLSQIITPKLRVSSTLMQLSDNDDINFQNNHHLFVRYK